MAKFECPHCSQKIDAPEELAGTATNCPACGEAITVPALSQKAEPPPLPPQPRVYVSSDGKTWGAYDTATLQRHVDDRKFLPTDLANVAGSDNWQPLNTIASFPVEPQQVVVHQQKEKKKTGILTWCVLFFFVLLVVINSSNDTGSVEGTNLKHESLVSQKTRNIVANMIAGETAYSKSLQYGFLMIDRTLSESTITNDEMGELSENDTARIVGESLSKSMAAATTVTKLLRYMSPSELEELYTHWCDRMGRTTASKFPDFIDLCQSPNVKKLCDDMIRSVGGVDD